jgi:hypothetical protein
MKKWLKRVRAAVVLGLIWGLGWGLVGGFIMEGIVDPQGRILDMWPQTLAIPGFLGGAIFSLVLLIAERRRRFSDLSVSRFAAWGAVVGLSLGALGLGLFGMSSVLRAAVIIGPLTLLTAGSAAASLSLARWGEKRELLGSAAEHDDMILGAGEVQK